MSKSRAEKPFNDLEVILNKLEVAYKDPAYFYCWQKDVGDNLRRMKAAQGVLGL